MKLVNTLVVAFLGTLMAAGCSSTSDSTADGGTDGGGTDSTPVDTGSGDTAKVDTGTATDAAPDTAGCSTCITSNCSTEATACGGESQCKDGLTCIGACTTTDCINKCLSDSKNPDGTLGNNKLAAYVGCVADKCKTDCGF